MDSCASSSLENHILPKPNPYLNNSLPSTNDITNSIKTFWSPELKKERQMRKYEYDKNIKYQTELKNLKNQLETIQNTSPDNYLITELRTQNEDLKYTLQEMENRLDIQQHTLDQRDVSIKRLITTLQNQGMSAVSTNQDSQDSSALFEANIKNSELQSQLLKQKDKIQDLQEKLDSQLNLHLTSNSTDAERKLSDYYRQHAALLKEKLDATLNELKEAKETQFYSTTTASQATITQLELTIDTLKQQNY